MSGFWAKVGILRYALAGMILVPSDCVAKPVPAPVKVAGVKVAGKTAIYGDWVAGCDNVGRCTAIGFPQLLLLTGLRESLPYEIAVIYQMDEYAGPDDSGTLELVPSADIIIDGIELFRLDNFEGSGAADFRFVYERKKVPAQAQPVILNAFAEDRKITGLNSNSGEPRVQFPRVGFAPVRNAMIKERTSTLGRRSDPAEVRPEMVWPVPAARTPGFAQLLESKQSFPCNPSRVSNHPDKFVIFGGALLFSLTCDRLSRNAKTFWYQLDGKHDFAAPVSLPEPRGQVQAGTSGLSNASFDPVSGILQSLTFSGPDGDCGIFQRWAITSAGWQMAERREMPVCGKGLKPQDWIRTYRAENMGRGWL